nr:hypothetical protein [Microbacterium bovistercoris]
MTAIAAGPAVEHATTRHLAALGDGHELPFIARTQATPLLVDGADVGAAWTFSYTVDPADRARPVLFLFNGGPGCSSVWLHLSGLGPFQAAVPGDPAAPVALADPLTASTDTILDVADLVFLDPVDTGFSRRPVGIDAEAISGADRDAALTAQVIRSWLTRHGRLGAPVFLLGESYGTIRAALTATCLRNESVPVAGVAMLGQCLNAQETTQRPGNPAGYVAALPFIAATAWYHGRSAHADLTLDAVTRQAHAFAIDEYAAALSLPDVDPETVRRLGEFSGLDDEQLRARRLRIDKEEFRTLLLADRGLVVGLTDTRYTVGAPPPASAQPYLDAADIRIDPVFAAAAARLFTDELGLTETEGYRFAAAAHDHWDYLEASAVSRFGGSARPSPFAIFDYPAHLAALLRSDPAARLFFGVGHFDALTTVGSLQHLRAQYGLPADRIAEGRYPAGHMMYTDPASRTALAADLRAFLRG